MYKMFSRYAEVLRLAYPLLLSTITFMVMNFCDMKFLANYSSEQMAAAMPCGSLINAMAVFFMNLVSYSGVMMAQYHGSGRKGACVSLLWTGEYLALACIVLLVLVLPFAGRLLLKLFLPAEIFGFGYTYFLTLMPAQFAMLAAAPFFGFYSGRGYTSVVSIINIVSAVLNVFLDWMLVLGRLGCPAMGIKGAGIATSAAVIFGASAIILYGLYQPDQREYPTRRLPRPDFPLLKTIFNFGIPSAMKASSSLANWSITLLVIGTLGAGALASSSIAISVANLCNGFNFAIGRATEILTGQAIGRKQRSEALTIMNAAWQLGLAYVALMLIPNILWGDRIIEIFAPENPGGNLDFADVARDARIILLINGVWMFFDSARIIPAALLNAAGDTKVTFLINLACAWGVGMLSILIMVLCFKAPVTVVWCGWLLFSVTEGVCVYLRVKSGRWRSIQMV